MYGIQAIKIVYSKKLNLEKIIFLKFDLTATSQPSPFLLQFDTKRSSVYKLLLLQWLPYVIYNVNYVLTKHNLFSSRNLILLYLR